MELSAVRGAITADAERKVSTALAHFEDHVGGAALLDRFELARPEIMTPPMFEHALIARARAQPRRIVLPEGTEERVLCAAEIILRLGAAELTLLGDPTDIRATANELRVDVDGATLVDPEDSDLRERFAAEHAQRRAHEGTTLDLAGTS